MTNAFEPGDPVLELAALGQGIPITVVDKDDQPWIRKAEQLKIDEVCTSGGNIFPTRLPNFGSINVPLTVEARAIARTFTMRV